MLISILNRINEINEGMFAGFDGIIENFGMPDWLSGNHPAGVTGIVIVYCVFYN